MLLVDLLGWWYSRGWAWICKTVFVQQGAKILHFFSITDLLKTLFAPFRQDAVNVKGAPIGIRLQALGENIISRILGLMIRLVLVVLGLTLLAANTVFAAAAALVWPLMPLAPVAAIILITQGVGL